LAEKRNKEKRKNQPMSSGTETAPGAAGPWPILDVQERRVLGVLVEKAKTTPDAYPLSVNAIVTGANQKSNRDPILILDESDVEDALSRCKAKGLVMKVIGGRVDRWRHLLYESWHVDKVELAILAELLLRGPQTEGELRTRAGRMEPIATFDSLRQTLKPLVERNLVLYLTPQERRGAVLTHGFHDPHELELLTKHYATAAASSATPAAVSGGASSPAISPKWEEKLLALETTVAGLREELTLTRGQLVEAQQKVAALETQLAEVRKTASATREEVLGLRQALGG
jgi:uncharacterized protein YceH (UPF0502 family)